MFNGISSVRLLLLPPVHRAQSVYTEAYVKSVDANTPRNTIVPTSGRDTPIEPRYVTRSHANDTNKPPPDISDRTIVSVECERPIRKRKRRDGGGRRPTERSLRLQNGKRDPRGAEGGEELRGSPIANRSCGKIEAELVNQASVGRGLLVPRVKNRRFPAVNFGDPSTKPSFV